MTGFKDKVGAWYLLPALMLLTIILSVTIPATSTDVAYGEDEPWLEVTVLYSSDIRGKIEPCG